MYSQTCCNDHLSYATIFGSSQCVLWSFATPKIPSSKSTSVLYFLSIRRYNKDGHYFFFLLCLGVHNSKHAPLFYRNPKWMHCKAFTFILQSASLGDHRSLKIIITPMITYLNAEECIQICDQNITLQKHKQSSNLFLHFFI